MSTGLCFDVLGLALGARTGHSLKMSHDSLPFSVVDRLHDVSESSFRRDPFLSLRGVSAR